MKIGAFDFLTKPFEPERLLESVRRGMSLSALRKQPVEAIAPAAADKNDLLLEAMNVLGEAYSLGLNKGQLLEELAYLEAEARYHAESLGQIKKKERAILDMRRRTAGRRFHHGEVRLPEERADPGPARRPGEVQLDSPAHHALDFGAG